MLRQFPLDRAPRPGRTPPGPPPVPRPAATVMLVRDRQAPSGNGSRPGPGVEVFVFRRVAGMPFAAGMHAFPGGRVDERDAAALPWHGPGPEDFAGPLSADVPLARALVVAAVRETFEECGVLLASPPGSDRVPGLSGDGDATWRDRHRRLVAGELGLAEVLADAGLLLRADLLRPWAHWITPPGEGRRYDTRFFVAELPPGQSPRDLGGEGEQARWLAAADGVHEHRAGRIRMLPPTVVCLEDLAAAGSVPELMAAPRRIRPVMPWPVTTADGSVAVEVDLDGVGGGEPRA